jgi:tRNA-specific 2-thiouridylase
MRAVGLLSGGLDSGLAARVILDQGIEVAAVAFTTPFFGPEKARRMADQLDIPLRIVDFTDEHLALVRDPPHGYGNNMNPCIDCHALMLRRAGELLPRLPARFLFTGEVLNQRPMSQNARSLAQVERLSGMAGLVLRPLSARVLPETPMEKEGAVDRTRLLDLSGRGRKRQIELAARWSIRDYPAPAGGCLLTDPGFSARLRDLFAREPGAGIREIELLKHGRHFRLPGGSRAVVGRDQADNQALETLSSPADLLFFLEDATGPITLLTPPAGEDDRLLAAALTAGHSRLAREKEVGVAERGAGGWSVTRRVAPLPRAVMEPLRIA